MRTKKNVNGVKVMMANSRVLLLSSGISKTAVSFREVIDGGLEFVGRVGGNLSGFCWSNAVFDGTVWFLVHYCMEIGKAD
jgi:hypothetical protein